MNNAPFTVNPTYTAVSVAYKNATLIADLVLPRVPTDGEKFTYLKFPMGQSFTVPNTKVGRRGVPNQVEFQSEEVPDVVQDYGLDSPVPNSDVESWRAAVNNGNKGLPDPRLLAATETTDLIALDREIRTAALVFNAATYGTNNKVVLSGSSQWDDDASDPEEAFMDAMDSMIMRPTVGVFGRRVWSKLSRNPKLRSAVLGSTTKGQITRREFAEHFELREVFVGEGWVNIARKGQPTTNMVRVWGNHAALLHQNPVASTKYGTTFGFTAQWGSRIAGEIQNPDIGIRGGVKVRVAESLKELVTANDLGFYFQNAISS